MPIYMRITLFFLLNSTSQKRLFTQYSFIYIILFVVSIPLLLSLCEMHAVFNYMLIHSDAALQASRLSGRVVVGDIFFSLHHLPFVLSIDNISFHLLIFFFVVVCKCCQCRFCLFFLLLLFFNINLFSIGIFKTLNTII